MHVDHGCRGRRTSAEREQLSDEAGRALGRTGELLQVGAELRAFGRGVEHLLRARRDRADELVEILGDTGCESTDGLELATLGDVAGIDDESADGWVVVAVVPDGFEDPPGSVARSEAEIVDGPDAAFGEILRQRAQDPFLVVGVDELEDRTITPIGRVETEDALHRRARFEDAAGLVQHDDHVRRVLDQRTRSLFAPSKGLLSFDPVGDVDGSTDETGELAVGESGCGVHLEPPPFTVGSEHPGRDRVRGPGRKSGVPRREDALVVIGVEDARAVFQLGALACAAELAPRSVDGVQGAVPISGPDQGRGRVGDVAEARFALLQLGHSVLETCFALLESSLGVLKSSVGVVKSSVALLESCLGVLDGSLEPAGHVGDDGFVIGDVPPGPEQVADLAGIVGHRADPVTAPADQAVGFGADLGRVLDRCRGADDLVVPGEV